jgi:hypothetical protein
MGDEIAIYIGRPQARGVARVFGTLRVLRAPIEVIQAAIGVSHASGGAGYADGGVT